MSVSPWAAPTAGDRALLSSLAALYDRSPDAVLIAEAGGGATAGPTILHVNAAFTALSGFSPAEVVGRSCAWLEPQGDGVSDQTIRTALFEGRSARTELEVLRKDATPCWVELSLLPVADGSEPVNRFIIVARDVSARREAERLRQRAELQLRDTLDNISDGLAICDADDRLVICNRRYVQILPYLRTLGALKGRTYEELVRYGVTCGNVLDAGKMRDAEHWIALRLERHRTASGTPYLRQLPNGRWLQTTEHRSSDGGVVTVLTDMTPAKQAETRLRDAIESIDDVFTLWDDEARLLMWNRRFPATWPELADLLEPGVTQRALIERNIDRGVLQIPAEERERYIQGRIDLHRTPASEVELERADGRIFLIRAHRTAEGGQVRLETEITDLKRRQLELRAAKEAAEAASRAAVSEIIAHKRAAEALSRSQQQLKRAQQIASTGSAERYFATNLEEWSDETYRIFGVDRASFTTSESDILRLIHESDRERMRTLTAMARAGRRPMPEEFRVVRPDGEVRTIYCESDLALDAAWNPASLVMIFKDVTQLRAAEEREREAQNRLQHSQKLEALGTLAGGVAHELNNALVPVLALAKTTAKRLPEHGRERGNLDMILKAGERARDLVQQILAFSRKEAPVRRSIDVAELVRDVMKMLRATMPSTVKMEARISPVPPLSGDPDKLNQVVTNLVTNAGQAIGNQMGTITVEVACVPSPGNEAGLPLIQLSVRDTGVGMDEATVERIFEPFFTTKSVGEGTGLGLSVVHGIVGEHGGRIVVESRLGEGTRFDVFLPALVAEPARADSEGPQTR